MATRSKPQAKTESPETAPPAQAPDVDEPSVQPARARGTRGSAQDASIPEDELRAMIEHEAYLRAERRGFEPGHEEEDWLAAEAQVRSTLRGAGPQKH
jgi:hypothetical protein